MTRVYNERASRADKREKGVCNSIFEQLRLMRLEGHCKVETN